jgi:hypothetical protein
MRYIQKLQDSLPILKNWLDDAVDRNQLQNWDSLVINRRKPHTYRAFTMFGEDRICLHRFEPCSEAEAFIHPHPWPGAFLVISGSYRHLVARSENLKDRPFEVMDSIMCKGSTYQIIDPRVWHIVQPLETSYTIMLNGPVWDVQHKETRTTKGKDLEKMSESDLRTHLKVFQEFLREYL